MAALSWIETPLTADLPRLPIAGRSVAMSSVGLALSRTASISQEFAQEPAPNRIPTSPAPDNVALGPPPNFAPSEVPEDTVTISKALLPAPQNQSTKGGVIRGENSAAPETSRAAAGSYDLLNAKSNSNPSAVSSAQVKADGTPKSSKSTAVQPTSVSAQEQLQQLDRTLQQLGINPESVSLIRRVELLRLANNPAALEQYFQSSFPPTSIETSQVRSGAAVTASAAVNASSSSSYQPTTNQSPKSTADVAHINISA
jgi:hypothetical protein